MAIGLRGPCNLFGHPTDRHLQDLDVELSQWDRYEYELVTKIVFGHFPLSFTACTESGKRPEWIFAKHAISAYLCGHLHTKFGTNLFKHHSHDTKHGEFWEWEMGDWKQSRLMRIIAIDKGHTSFLDINLSSLDSSYHGTLIELPTIVVPTYPLDSQTMERSTLQHSSTYHDAIRALVFSQEPVISVNAKIYDSATNPLSLIEELKMEPLSKSNDRSLLFSAAWNRSKYLDASPERYSFQIEVLHLQGRKTNSRLRTFSAASKISQLKWTWSEFFVMGIVWDTLYTILIWMIFLIFLMLLVFPKTLLFLLRKGYFKKMVFLTLKNFSCKRLDMKQAVVLFLWALLQSCEDHAMWWSQQLFVVYLFFFPWFWGSPLTEDYPAGYMTIRGWTVNTMLMNENVQSALGMPDIMVVVLPYLYCVVFPLFALILALSAERSFLELHILSHQKEQCSATTNVAIAHKHLDVLYLNGFFGVKEHTNSCKLCRRWIRTGLYICCMAIMTIHIRQTRTLIRAYGLKVLWMSPGFAWPVPLLLFQALYWNSVCRKPTCWPDNKNN